MSVEAVSSFGMLYCLVFGARAGGGLTEGIVGGGIGLWEGTN